MITGKGRNIIAKYMLGQAPEYAAYLAVGTGFNPQFEHDDPLLKSLLFEAFRVPVLSRGLVNDTIVLPLTAWSITGNYVEASVGSESGLLVGDTFTIAFTNPAHAARNGTFVVDYTSLGVINYIDTLADDTWTPGVGDTAEITYMRERLVFKAQLPPDQHYRMTEMAVYPAANNQLALGYDSRALLGFTTSEGWTLGGGEIIYNPNNITTGGLALAALDDALFVGADNPGFAVVSRNQAYESPRYLNEALMVSGSTSSFANDACDLISGIAVEPSNVSWDFSKNSPYDVIKLAFSVIPAVSTNPFKTRVRIELIDSQGIIATVAQTYYDGDLGTRYVVMERSLSQFILDSSTFKWSSVTGIAIYIQTLDSLDAWDGSYVCLDGLRIDNINTENPLYGLVAASVMTTPGPNNLPITKSENSQGYIEYRMGVSIA